MKQTWADLPIGKKGAVAFALALLPVLAAVAVQAAHTSAIKGIDSQLPLDRENRLAQAELVGLLVDAETGVRGYLLSDNPRYLDPYDRAVERVPALLRKVSAHEQNVDHRDDFQEITTLVQREMQLLDRLLAGASKPLLEEAKTVMDRIRALIASLELEEDRQIQALANRREDLYRQNSVVLAGSLALALLAAASAGRLLLRSVVSRVRAVRANAQRLADGEELAPIGGGMDEVGDLADLLTQTAHRLRARESALRQKTTEADEANQAKSEFLSRMSHELRTPLNAILGFAELGRQDAQGELRTDIDQIHLAGRHLLDLINEVLDIARIESGQLSLSVEPVEVAGVVTESITLVSGAAAHRRIEIDADGGQGNDQVYVKADRQRLKQVVVNLLSNAIKYNRDDGNVTVRFELRGDLLRLSVTDTGPGLPSTAAERLFTPFARLGAETTNVEGTGLGLALSKSLMETMGGDLAVGRSDSSGTEFFLQLPVAAEPVAETPTVDETERSVVDVSLVSVTVLQVEDNPSNIRLVERIMQRRSDVQLVTADTGRAGLEFARELRPDLILLDLNLPDMSGQEVLAKLRSDPVTSSLRVVMLSADATASQIARMKEAGAADYLTKPFEVRALLGVVDAAIGAQPAA